MVGRINFELLDPNSVMKGAESTNKMLSEYARQKAGKLMASGRKKEALDSLYNDGNLRDAQDLQVNINENDQNVAKLSTDERKRQTEMVQDAANVLTNVLKTQGPAAVLPAYQQMKPLFIHHGATEEQLAPIERGLETNPAAFLQNLTAYANSHASTYDLSPGQTRYQGTTPIAHAPAAPRFINTTAGGQLSQVDQDANPMVGSSPDVPVSVETDADYAALPSGTHYTTPDGHIRVKQ